MVDQRLDICNETQRVRQPGMNVEGIFVDPAGMYVEEAWIAGGTKGVNAEAAAFLARSGDYIVDGRLQSCLIAGLRVKARKDM